MISGLSEALCLTASWPRDASFVIGFSPGLNESVPAAVVAPAPRTAPAGKPTRLKLTSLGSEPTGIETVAEPRATSSAWELERESSIDWRPPTPTNSNEAGVEWSVPWATRAVYGTATSTYSVPFIATTTVPLYSPSSSPRYVMFATETWPPAGSTVPATKPSRSRFGSGASG